MKKTITYVSLIVAFSAQSLFSAGVVSIYANSVGGFFQMPDSSLLGTGDSLQYGYLNSELTPGASFSDIVSAFENLTPLNTGAPTSFNFSSDGTVVQEDLKPAPDFDPQDPTRLYLLAFTGENLLTTTHYALISGSGSGWISPDSSESGSGLAVLGPANNSAEYVIAGSVQGNNIALTPVPEPQFFGAIAGVLALGFVWMRRRRAAKA